MEGDPRFIAVMRAVATAHQDPSTHRERILILARTFKLGSECELLLTSLEAWTTWFSLGYELFAGEGARGLEMERTHRTVWEARDDRGARYEGVGAAGGGDARRWDGHVWFHPGLHPNAEHLALSVPDPSAYGYLIEVQLDLSA